MAREPFYYVSASRDRPSELRISLDFGGAYSSPYVMRESLVGRWTEPQQVAPASWALGLMFVVAAGPVDVPMPCITLNGIDTESHWLNTGDTQLIVWTEGLETFDKAPWPQLKAAIAAGKLRVVGTEIVQIGDDANPVVATEDFRARMEAKLAAGAQTG